MERELDTSADSAPTAESSLARSAGRRRRTSALGALTRIAVAVAILGAAGYQVLSMISDRPAPVERQPRERSFTVSVVEPVLQTVQTHLTTYGEIAAARSLDIRSQVAGEVVEMSPNLKVGGAVEEAEVLLRVDPFEYDGQVTLARANLADAQLALGEARSARELEVSALEFARTQLAAGERDLDRARTLMNRGSATQQTVEQFELTVAERRQAVAQHQSSLVSLEAEILRRQAAIESARWSLDQALRAQANTVVKAPFAGIVTAENVDLASVVANNETLVSMYETASLNLRFVVSDQQYGQLTRLGLEGRPVQAVWQIEPEPLVIDGAIDRAGARIDAASGGVEMFATLNSAQSAAIRPGTFVQVSVAGPRFEGVLRLPETAVYGGDHIFVVRDGRMARIDAEVLGHEGEDVIVRAEIPDGESVITTRLAQAGEGLRVAVEGEAPEGGFRPGQGGFRGPGGGIPPG